MVIKVIAQWVDMTQTHTHTHTSFPAVDKVSKAMDETGSVSGYPIRCCVNVSECVCFSNQEIRRHESDTQNAFFSFPEVEEVFWFEV